jgi:hypothetical protein
MGAGTHEKHLDIARSLAEKFGVSTQGLPENSDCCSHH